MGLFTEQTHEAFGRKPERRTLVPFSLPSTFFFIAYYIVILVQNSMFCHFLTLVKL